MRARAGVACAPIVKAITHVLSIAQLHACALYCHRCAHVRGNGIVVISQLPRRDTHTLFVPRRRLCAAVSCQRNAIGTEIRVAMSSTSVYIGHEIDDATAPAVVL